MCSRFFLPLGGLYGVTRSEVGAVRTRGPGYAEDVDVYSKNHELEVHKKDLVAEVSTLIKFPAANFLEQCSSTY